MDRGIGVYADTPDASWKASEALQVRWKNKDVSPTCPTLTVGRRLIQRLERPDVSARHDADVPVALDEQRPLIAWSHKVASPLEDRYPRTPGTTGGWTRRHGHYQLAIRVS